jgi:hypothetical protein
VAALCLPLVQCGAKPHDHGAVFHVGMANASAVVPAGPKHFLAASDEDNLLKLYPVDAETAPLAVFDAAPWLALQGKSEEADFEGAARIGDLVFWIGSHGRNKDGKHRPNRQRLLVTRLVGEGDQAKLEPVGEAYPWLLDDLARAPQLASFDLSGAARMSPEEPGALNIEGLAATADGGLLVAFRSPVPEGKALLVPILNPAELATGKRARLGEAILLDLGGNGVRDITWSGRDYYLISGKAGSGGKQQLFRWHGPGSPPEAVENPGFKSFNPEALAVFGSAENPRVLVVSDDGNRKQSKNPERRRFRSFWVQP